MSSARRSVSALEADWLTVTVSLLITSASAGVMYLLMKLIWGKHIVTSMKYLYGDGFVLEGLVRVWFIFVWGALATLVIIAVLGRRRSYESRSETAVRGLWISLNAGVFEEITYRAFTFMSVMPVLVFLDWITFGLMKWFYTTISIPVANFFTFGALEEHLTSSSWLFGAAIISASVAFRNAHKHLGLFGFINSWFIGMVMFYLVLNYGLLTAIAAHFLYDAIIFTIIAVTSMEESSEARLSRLIQARYGR